MTERPRPRPRLLDPTELAEQGPPEAVRLPLDLIDSSPVNPRKALAEIPELAASIREFGLLQPIAVRRSGARFELIAGHRRFAAFSLLRDQEPTEVVWRTIPATVRTESDNERARLMLIAAQIQTAAWSSKEEASMLESLATTMTLTDIGSLIHKTKAWVSHRLSVYADAVLGALVQTGRLSVSVAEELRHAKDPDQRRQLADRAIAEGWGPDRARTEVQKLKKGAQPVTEIGRRALELLELLASIPANEIDKNTFRDLQVLRGRIEQIADEARSGAGPVFPSLERARQVAGVKANARPRKSQPKRRMMPRPS